MIAEFKGWPKIARLNREVIVSEKLDGTSVVLCITEDGHIHAGSRNRWLWSSTDDKICNDHHGFAQWVRTNKDELMTLGVGYHNGEWMGQGIQRNYGLKEKRFYLFNTAKWTDDAVRPKCCHVVPILYRGLFDTVEIRRALQYLAFDGSWAVPNFMNPEGIVVFHTHSGSMFKVTIKNDTKGKGENK